MTLNINDQVTSIPTRRRTLCLSALGALGVLATPKLALAQPGGLYSFLVTFSPGGPADTVVRNIHPALQAELGQTVIVENIPGAGGALGAQKLLQNGPTGRTLMLATTDEAFLTPLALAAAKYKSDDLRLVSVLSRSEYALAARSNFPMDIHEFIKSKQNVTNGILGPASVYRLAMEDFKARTGIKQTHVPYKGMANIINDLLGGFVDVAFIPVAGSVPAMLAENKFKLLAVATANRMPGYPSIPTVSEVLKTKFEYSVAPGVVVHRDTPEPAVQRLHNILEKIKATPEFKKFTESTASIVMPQMTLAETQAFYASEAKRFKALADAANITPQ